jgi:type IV secretory pathway VirB10-like protein
MFDRIRTGQVSKKWGFIITIGASACILLIVLSGYFFNTQNRNVVKGEEKQYSVENNLKSAEKVASGLARNISSTSVDEKAKSHEETSKYDAKAAFSENAGDSESYSSKSIASQDIRLPDPEQTLASEDYLREYVKYREKGNLLDRNTKSEDYSYTAEASQERVKEKSQKVSELNLNRAAEYRKAKAAPTRVELHFNHDEAAGSVKHINEASSSSGNRRDTDVFTTSDERNTSFDKENQTLSKYEVFERDSFDLNNEVVKPKTPFALMQGTVIPAILSTGINSELPGQISAMVTRDIRDSIRGRFLLIPKGSKLLGQYGSTAAFGAQRLFLGFNRIIFPNGHSINIGSMPGQSPDGFAGFDAEVDNHFFRILANCFFLSSITTAASSVQQTYGTSSGVGTLYTTQARELSSDVSEALSRIIERNINLAPTLKVQPGYKFTISLTKDIFFKEPYGANHEEYFIKY